MATVNSLAREIVFKIVYYGPGLGGKTTTLQHLHATAKPEHRGRLVSLATPGDRTLYFDFLPILLPKMRGMGVRLQLYTVPGQVYYDATRKLVLQGADGLVFVADSQPSRMDANLESLQNLHDNLREQGLELSRVPHLFQHNKRDLDDTTPLAELDRALNRNGAPSLGTSAALGDGVYEGLETIARLVFEDFERRAPSVETRTVPNLHEDDGGLAAALRGASSFAIPGEDLSQAIVHAAAAIEAPAALPPSSDADEGETPVQPAFSLAELWPEAERDLVKRAEAAIAATDFPLAIELCHQLVARTFASAAGLFGTSDAPRDPTMVPLLLGLDGRRYLAFRALVRDARGGAEVTARQALQAIAFAAEARIVRGGLST